MSEKNGIRRHSFGDTHDFLAYLVTREQAETAIPEPNSGIGDRPVNPPLLRRVGQLMVRRGGRRPDLSVVPAPEPESGS